MIFRSGKYKGQSVERVKQIAPWYIRWVRENRPEMLVERKFKKQPPPAAPRMKLKPIPPNLNFDYETE